jgi:TRAP-type mannitol/chloroaromatic compound transport system permease small subunit
MNQLLGLARTIDALNTRIGRAVSWLVLAVCAVAAGAAIIGKVSGARSNVWLEMQWLMFSAVFLLAAPWTLRVNEHIRIDIVNQRLSGRVRSWIEVIGHALFLLPMAGLILWTSIPFALTSWRQNEGSSNFGGLPQWPLKLLIPLAFALLLAQGVSELIKRIAILRGALADPAGDPPRKPEVPHDI